MNQTCISRTQSILEPDESKTTFNELSNNKSDSIKTRAVSFRSIVTNARSLTPKIHDLIINFEELDLNVAIISESWLKEGKKLRNDLDDLEFGSNLRTIHKSRKSRRGRTAGGGICIIFNKSKIHLKERNIRRGKSEIVCATGNIPTVARKVLVFGIYIPPNIKAKQAHNALESLSNAIGQAKIEYSDPLIIIEGDFNQWNVGEAIHDYTDITVLKTGPTRGNKTIDLLATNFTQDITESSIKDPLRCEEGRQSDHRVVYSEAQIDRSHRFHWKTYSYRPKTKKTAKI